MADIKNELTWSFSRKRTFDSCRRKYYYRHYLMWNGWLASAPAERRQAYRLSKMTTLSMFSGSLVHDTIAKALLRWKNNHLLMMLDEAVKCAQIDWKRAIADTLSERWESDPKRVMCFLEHYYAHQAWQEKAEDRWQRAVECLKSFWQSETWKDLQKSRPGRWLALDGDPFQTAPIEGIPVHGRPDLGYDASREGEPLSRCLVFDWKTGSQRPLDVLQVRYYGLYASSAWGFPAESLKARLVYLFPALLEEKVDLAPETLADAKRSLVESFQEMRSVLKDPDENIPLGMEHFPVTERIDLCGWCPFQEMCEKCEGPAMPPPSGASDDDFDPFV